MMKQIYKSTKVIYNAHLKQYEVYYKVWFFWKFDSCYKFDERDEKGYLVHPIHYCEKHQAEKRAIERAQSMLETVEVWRQTNYWYWS